MICIKCKIWQYSQYAETYVIWYVDKYAEYAQYVIDLIRKMYQFFCRMIYTMIWKYEWYVTICHQIQYAEYVK